MKFSMTGQDNHTVIFYTGDCLIEVTAWAGLTVILFMKTNEILKHFYTPTR